MSLAGSNYYRLAETVILLGEIYFRRYKPRDLARVTVQNHTGLTPF